MDTSDTDDRRRAIELILDRRPDVDVDALSDVLHHLDFDVDEATLLEDLDALGFEVADEQAGPVPTAPGPAPEGSGPGSEPSSGPRTIAGPSATGSTTGVPRSAGMIGAVMVLVGALLLAAILAGGGDEGTDAGAPAPTSAPLPAPDPTAPTSSTPAPLTPTPLGPGADPALGDGVDGEATFDGPDAAGLDGTAPAGLTWDVVAGEWSVAGGEVRLAPVPDGETALALVDPGLTDYRVQVRLPVLADNVGLAFWSDGAGEGWMFVASPTFSSFNLVRLEGGSFEVIGNTGLTTTKDRTATIGLHVTGNRVEALVDGAVLLEHEATDDPPGTAFGMGGLSGAPEGSFDDLVYKADG